MKSDTERKHFHFEPLHKRKNRLHVHLSKELRGSLKIKKRSLLLRKGDRVKIMRGPESGKEAKVMRVNTQRRKVFLEGIIVKNTRAKEVAFPIEPSNLLIVGIEKTKERELLFNESAFNKKEPKKEEKKKEHETPAKDHKSDKKEPEIHKADEKKEVKHEHTENLHKGKEDQKNHDRSVKHEHDLK